jgi:hypothetical protein
LKNDSTGSSGGPEEKKTKTNKKKSLLTWNVVLDSVNETVNESEKIKIEVDYVAYDFDSDGYVDYVEWIVPHLSEQVYEIIVITKALHLDANYTEISDIYEEVSVLDGNWSEEIPVGDYVRVSFEEELDNTNDITLYVRSACGDNSSVIINGTEVPCEIYRKKIRLDELRRENISENKTELLEVEDE